MATVPHVTSGSGLRKFQADGFLLDRVYLTEDALMLRYKANNLMLYRERVDAHSRESHKAVKYVVLKYNADFLNVDAGAGI